MDMSLNQKIESMNVIDEAINRLVVGSENELNPFLKPVSVDGKITGTDTNVHCYMVALDGMGRPRTKDLAKAVALKVVDYAIPKSEIKRARDYLLSTGSTSEILKLNVKAKKLFTHLENTGEGGEMLLYMLTQNHLQIPQLLAKMSLKTSSELHYNGADGVHIKFDQQNERLALYWGESKLYQSIDQAITNCLDSIEPFLIDDGGTDSRQMRDLQLITGNLDLCDAQLQAALLRYLNPDDELFNQLEYRGVCLIGFDEGLYPTQPKTKTQEEVKSEVGQALAKWESKISKKIKKRTPLDRIIMEVFFVPFPSVGKFRGYFLEEIKNG